jgi:alpha-ketoglutarate-dependent taurine dioxygenase
MQIERQTGSLGAYMSGVQLSELSSQRARSLVFEALNEHQVFEQNTHPVVRTHARTGRKALYVNSQYTKHFEGMTESKPLLDYLCAHASKPQFTWRHRWRLGDVLIWDNASVQHTVVSDLAGRRAASARTRTTLSEVPS